MIPRSAPATETLPPNDLFARLARLLTRVCTGAPWLVVAAGLLVTLSGAYLASRLHLQTDLSELLPPEAQSVKLLKHVNARLGGSGNVAIALESIDGKPDSLRRYMPILADAIRAQLGTDLLSLKYSRKEVGDFYGKFGVWYLPVEDLQKWSDRLSEAIAHEANPLLLDLDDEGDGGKRALKKLVDEARGERKKVEPSNEADESTGLLIAEKGKIGVIFVRPAANALNLAGSEGMLDRIKAIVAGTHPEQYGVRLPPPGFTGSIPTALSEFRSVERDIVGTALLVCAMVGAVVILYFRGLRELFLLSGALVIGATVALGYVAYLWIGHLNGQTAFLGSIIVGTGINYGIILLDRYRRARSHSTSFAAALELAIGESLRATWIAALGTAVSFGVLAAGEVESFHQFGWIGGLGILACWAASFTFVPAMLTIIDGKKPIGPGVVDRKRILERLLPGSPLEWSFTWLGRLCQRFPRFIVAATVVGTVWSGVVAWRGRHTCVETNMQSLGTKSRATDIETLDHRLRSMDDRSSTPEVIAADNRDDATAVCEQLLARKASGELEGVMTNCHTLGDIFPKDVARRKLLMAKLGADLAKVPEDDLSADEKTELGTLKKNLVVPLPVDDDLPLALKEYFIERDGSLGKLAFVDPKDEHIEEKLYRFTDAIRHVTLPSGKVVETSGFTVVFADVLRAMRRDAQKLTIWAAVLVYLVLALVTRRLGTFLRVGSALLAGVVVMLGVAVVGGHKLNFFNFVALPTTFGIGIDYGINIEERLRQRGRRHLVAALAESGPAVLLASLTSIFGYASLLTADSRALSSFGSLAIIGEVTCVGFAVVLIPALWAFLKADAGAAAEPAAALQGVASAAE